MTDEQLIEDLADAVVDGAPVDWAVAETHAGADRSLRSLVRHLRLVASVADAQRDLVPPESWGHLRLLECVGRGTFGTVHRAWDPRLQREVALKLLPATPAQDDHVVLREGRLLARIRHPGVVTIHGAEQIGNQIGLWMEFVRGCTLEETVKSGAVFDAAEASAIGVAVGQALSAVHRAGLLHRDIKAHNVMRADDGRVVLMDFGTGIDISPEATASADLSGTPLYLAPEVLAGQPATVQSDIYSLGVLLYHTLTGDYPVRARTLAELRGEHEQNRRITLREARPDLPARLTRVIDKAIDPRADRRYASADALAADLAAEAPRAVPRRRVIGLAVAAVLFAGAVLAVLWSNGALGVRDGSPLLAVMPFRDLGGDPDSSTVADGLTIGLIQELARIDGLLVNSLESSLAFKNKPPVIAEVRRSLGAQYVVAGTLQVAGGVLRVHAQLVGAEHDTPLWSDDFDRPLQSAQEVFAIQDDIARAIVNKLRLRLGRGQRRYDETSLPLPVYYQYVTAQTLLGRRGAMSASQAATLFETVVAAHATYAPAWAGLAAALAEVNRVAPPQNLSMEPADATAKIRAAAERAIDLDPMLAEAHAAMGALLARERHWADAEAAFERALSINRSYPFTYTEFVLSTLVPLRRLDQALLLLEEARRIDPLSLDVMRTMAVIQVDDGRYDDAIKSCEAVLSRDPTVPFAAKTKARALALGGKLDEALAIFEQDPAEWAGEAYVYARLGQRDRAEAMAAAHPDRPGQLMLVYAGLGDKERAFAAFERVSTMNWWLAIHQLQRPELSLLWDDPRVTEIRRKLGLPPL